MECKFGCHERGNLQRLFSNEHRTEAETESDIQVGNLTNIAEHKANFMGSYILTTKLRTDCYNNQSQVYIMYKGKLET